MLWDDGLPGGVVHLRHVEPNLLSFLLVFLTCVVVSVLSVLQQLLEAAGVGYTGMTSDFAYKCSNRLALSKVKARKLVVSCDTVLTVQASTTCLPAPKSVVHLTIYRLSTVHG